MDSGTPYSVATGTAKYPRSKEAFCSVCPNQESVEMGLAQCLHNSVTSSSTATHHWIQIYLQHVGYQWVYSSLNTVQITDSAAGLLFNVLDSCLFSLRCVRLPHCSRSIHLGIIGFYLVLLHNVEVRALSSLTTDFISIFSSISILFLRYLLHKGSVCYIHPHSL